MLIDEGFRYSYHRKLKRALASGEFKIVHSEKYKNARHEEGFVYVCQYKGREFYLSEQLTEKPSDVSYFLRVLGDHKDISATPPLIWPNEHGEPCLYLEVWYLSRWHKFHTPIFKGPLDDEFVELIKTAAEFSKGKAVGNG